MNGPEIREKINDNNNKIRVLLDKFILTDEIKVLIADNERLREECKNHEFVNGFCKYCDTPIDFVEEK